MIQTYAAEEIDFTTECKTLNILTEKNVNREKTSNFESTIWLNGSKFEKNKT